MQIKLKKLSSKAKLPTYGSKNAAGADLCACIDESVNVLPGETVMIGTGIALAIPEGYAGLVYARSGMASKRDLAPANKVGVIDSDYRGEIIVALHNHGMVARMIEPGERIAQLVIAPVIHSEFEECDNLDTTERASGGFGSTGTM